MAGLEILGGESSVLADILDMPNDRSDEIQRKIEELCSSVVIELKRQKLTDFEDEYLERHAYSINEKIIDNRLRNSSIII